MKWSYDNTCRLQRKAAFQVHCMKRRRINATERDHYAAEGLHILIIWLHPALEISIVNWLMLLRSTNSQCTKVLRELTGSSTWEKEKKSRHEEAAKADDKRWEAWGFVSFNYLVILHWERVKQPSRLCPHSYGNPVYHNHFMYFILKYIHDIQKYSCLPAFEGTTPLTKLGHEPSTSMPSFFHYASIDVPCRPACSYSTG